MCGLQSTIAAAPMKTSRYPDNLEIAPGYTVACWRSLKLDPDLPESADWKTAVEIFESRIRRRFLDPVDELIRIEQSRSRKTFGFAVLAIDFLVIETLQAFREGEIDHKRRSARLVTSFFTRWNVFKNCLQQGASANQLAKRIYRGYRCALHHSGATDGSLRVVVSGPVFDFRNDPEVKINRTLLHKDLTHEFATHVAELRAPDANGLRCNFLRKMDVICGVDQDTEFGDATACT
jgi:hypothetical protein